MVYCDLIRLPGPRYESGLEPDMVPVDRIWLDLEQSTPRYKIWSKHQVELIFNLKSRGSESAAISESKYDSWQSDSNFYLDPNWGNKAMMNRRRWWRLLWWDHHYLLGSERWETKEEKIKDQYFFFLFLWRKNDTYYGLLNYCVWDINKNVCITERQRVPAMNSPQFSRSWTNTRTLIQAKAGS